MSKINNKNEIVVSNVASYFSRNLQQIGFNSNQRAVLFSLKEALDNSLDIVDTMDGEVLPEISVIIEKLGEGHTKNSDKIRLVVTDNGTGIQKDDLGKVFGVFLASSKATRQSPTRGSQGLGISAVNNWAQMTQARGVYVITKTKKMKKAICAVVECDTKNNQGIVKNLKEIDWDQPHGTSVEFIFDGKVVVNGESSVTAYLEGTALVNPALNLKYKILDNEEVVIKRVTEALPSVPEPIAPHPHTLKLGEFIAHAHEFANISVEKWLTTGFSRVSPAIINEIIKKGFNKKLIKGNSSALTDEHIKQLYQIIQNLTLQEPSTRSVLSIGEEALSKSVQRMGNIDFFSVITRKPTICDFRPVQIEVAIARLQDVKTIDDPVKVMRFANRVPLVFSKNGCITTEAIKSVNWKAYGLSQAKESLPVGPYVIAVSVVSPAMKFTNAAKESISGDIDGELYNEIRLALIQAGQKLAKFVKKEAKEEDLERKRQYIEMFSPILINCLFDLTKEPQSRRPKMEKGLKTILGRETAEVKEELKAVKAKIAKQEEKDHGKE
jgi:DNA topoisomerase-6 subunit B